MFQKKASRSLLFFTTILFIINWLPPITTEIVIQDVRWTKEYDELDENYYGTCRFVESPCGPRSDGVCMRSGRCYKNGGWISSLDCNGGIGECCHIEKRCYAGETHVEVDQLVTNLVSWDGWYNSQDPFCSFRFRKDPEICQIRLDFINFNTSCANEDGDCDTDSLRIKNSITVSNEFTTCGELTGQHMYLAFASDDDVIEVIQQTKSIDTYTHIVATKIPCNSRKRVPAHCLQYYSNSTDRVKSFDFGRQQQNNQQYTICVQPSTQSSQIQWRPCPGVSNALNIISNIQAEPATCNTDWIQVKGMEKVCEPFVHQTSTWKAYELLVNFDDHELSSSVPPPLMLPVDPTNCPVACMSDRPDLYDGCQCVDMVLGSPGNQSCQCMFLGGGQPLPPMDFNNAGFCLEYSQI